MHTCKQSQWEIHLDVKNAQMHTLKNGKILYLKIATPLNETNDTYFRSD